MTVRFSNKQDQDKGACILRFKLWLPKAAAKTKTLWLVGRYYGKKIFYTLKVRFPDFSRFYSSHFPAMKVRPKMDRLEYAFAFSNELLACILVITVAAANLFLFGFAEASSYDNSLTAKFLRSHSDLNPALYARENSIKTVVEHNGFVASAYADGIQEALQSNAQEADNAPEQNVTGGVMFKDNPDTIRQLMEKQITVYETQPGDTLAAVARKFNLTINTIKWANGLESELIKPGWFLRIPPINGVLYQVDNNDTLPDIAEAFSGDMQTIISYNGLDSAEGIEPGQWIIIPDGKVTPPAQPQPQPQPKPGNKQPKPTTPKITIPSGKGHRFPSGYCTYYVASKRKITFGGNAKQWLTNAKSAGYQTGSTPAVGAVVVTTDSARYGHVAYVESVSGDSFTVSEMNYEGFGIVNKRTISKTSSSVRGFIY